MREEKLRCVHEALKEYFEYLDDLGERGVVSILRASSYLQGEFGLSEKCARKILVDWILDAAEME